MRLAANSMMVALLAGCLAGCATEPSAPVDPVALARAKSYVGKKYKLPVNVQLLCPRPDIPINQGDNCITATDEGATTVIDVVESRGMIFPKLRLSTGQEGYVLEDELNFLETQSRPNPKIGMSESDALNTNWGYPDKRNTTESAGQRVEQWVFPHLGYLYIEDGILRTIQRSE